MHLPTTPTLLATLTLLSTTQAHYMDIVGDWRWKLNKPQLIYNPHLENNARKTVIDSNGQMIHQLNPSTFGQVLGPSDPSDDGFWRVFVGGWLCERPDFPGMNGICATAGQGWIHDSVGHADILMSIYQDYKTIGCANHAGIWACDVGY